MKAILMAFKSKRIAKIHNGEKILEIRKRFPLDYVGWVYIYCTENSNPLHKNVADIWWVEDKGFQKENKRLGIEQEPAYNGKVVARFWCDNVEEIFKHAYQCGNIDIGIDYDVELITPSLCEIELIKQSRLTKDELYKYLFWCAPENKISLGLAIPISQLEIFDEPKELSEFENYNMVREVELNAEYYKGFDTSKITVVKKAPQSWFYVEER